MPSDNWEKCTDHEAKRVRYLLETLPSVEVKGDANKWTLAVNGRNVYAHKSWQKKEYSITSRNVYETKTYKESWRRKGTPTLDHVHAELVKLYTTNQTDGN